MTEKPVSLGGRPRHSGVVTDDPREGIINAAAELFTKNGFYSTRMSEIAKLAGLRQPSVYYWFRSRDEILRAIMDQNRASLIVARALSGRSESAAVRLYIVLYHDVLQMCSAPLNFFDLEAAATKQPDVFSDFHRDYAELSDKLEGIVEDGIASGQFRTVAARQYVRTALNLNEGSQHRFHVSGGDLVSMQEYADLAAGFSTRVLLEDVHTFARVRQAAQEGIIGFRAAGNGGADTLRSADDAEHSGE